MYRVTSRLTCVVVLAICLTAVAPQARATAISANGTTVFLDGSERSANGVAPGTNDPNVGTWSVAGVEGTATTMTATRTGGPTAAYQDTSYLELMYSGANMPEISALLNGGSVQRSSTSLHYEGEVFMTMATNNSFNFEFKDSAATGQANRLVPIRIGGASPGESSLNIYYLNQAGSAWVDTGLDLVDTTWTKLALDWNALTSTFSVQVNDGTAYPISGIWGTATSIDRLTIVGSRSAARGYLDSTNSVLPEPSVLVLLATGVLGLSAYTWRRRKMS